MVDVELRQTSHACPEQYDALVGDRIVGYLRLRHGEFTVECPGVGGDLVYQAEPLGDGSFEDDERERFLSEARSAIAKWLEVRA